jgi:hypothetical protein
MRLTQEQQSAIRTAASEAFGAGATVWLFGSRVDDHKKGGDIDLVIEAECDTRPIVSIAHATGIQIK